MRFENATIELNGIKEVVFYRRTVWKRSQVCPHRWLKYKILIDNDEKVLGGMSEQEMHDILEHHMQPGGGYTVSVSGTTINVKRKE